VSIAHCGMMPATCQPGAVADVETTCVLKQVACFQAHAGASALVNFQLVSTHRDSYGMSCVRDLLYFSDNDHESDLTPRTVCKAAMLKLLLNGMDEEP
jgi:hypothetical protein